MTKQTTLQVWAAARFDPLPHVKTLQRWARDGWIYPAPEKIGKLYRVDPDAVFIGRDQASTPYKLEVVGSVRCHSDAKSRQVEREAHITLKPFKVASEWYSVTPEVQAYVDQLLVTRFKPERRKAAKPAKPFVPPPLSKEDLEGTLPIPEAAAKYGLDVKKLRGRIHQRRGLFEMRGCLIYDVVYDDIYLQRLKDDPAMRDRGSFQP